MKTYNDLFGKIVDKENIRKAVFEAAKHKKKLKSVKRTLKNIDEVVERIHKELINGTWAPPKIHKTKVINDGVTLKKRVIICPEFDSEQIVHHAILQIIFPLFSKKFYWWSCGSIPEHGREMAIRKIQSCIKKHRNYCKYVVKLDVKKFFPSIKPSKVFHELRKTIRGKNVLLLLSKILRNNRAILESGEVVKIGIPIGFYCSPFFANIVLNPIDHIIKDNNGIKVYIRYMDDMLLFHNNKRVLKNVIVEITNGLNNRKLNLKYIPQVHLFINQPVEFIGFTLFINKTRLRAEIFLRACRTCRRVLKKEKLTTYDAQRILSYAGQFKYANAHTAFVNNISSKISIKHCKCLVSRKSRLKHRMEWRNSEGNSKPIEVEAIKSGKVYVRRNIKEETRIDTSGATTVIYTYQECLMSPTEYQVYSMKKQKALLDFIAMETGVDLDA